MARAILVGATVLATALAPKAHGQSPPTPDETAMAYPRLAPRAPGPGGDGVALPQPLAPSTAARLRQIFRLQARGDIAEAVRRSLDLEEEAAKDSLVLGMLGHAVADRHLGPHTRTSASDLQAWLERWPDLPDAPAVHALLTRRLPRGTSPPPEPVVARIMRAAEPAPVPEETVPTGPTLSRLPAIDRTVRDAARNGPFGAATRAIRAQSDLPAGYEALLRGEAAQILFARNRDTEAYQVGAIGADSCRRARSMACITVAAPGYWAGLAAWRLGRFDKARSMFELAWHAEIATSAQRAAAAFWAARTHLQLGDTALHHLWLTRAAEERRTFYGLIAGRALGLAAGTDENGRETLGEADFAAIDAQPPGRRAFALLQIGQRDRAEAELRLLWPAAMTSPALARAVMLVAEQSGLPNLAAHMADLAHAADGLPRERTRFAVPRLRPAGGFTVDPALVYAIARTESNFDPDVVSPAGARGLMQLMPATARFLADNPSQPVDRLGLDNPAINLKLGQRYINFLAATHIVAGDKIRLLASYNSGPTAFGRWSAEIQDNGDPLLFIEAIPIDQTRAYVPRVLAYTWLYAQRLRLPAPSLDELAAGLWPRYAGPTPPPTLH
jgi:soluble lytic murein transglycosylase-like protein